MPSSPTPTDRVIAVAVPVPGLGLLRYRVPGPGRLVKGARVVVPLGPRAVTDRLLGIFERTLKLPGKLVVPPVDEAAPPPR